MKVRDVIQGKSGDIVTTWPEQRVEAAARLLGQQNVGAMPVMDGERVVGMLSERDVSRAVGERLGTLPELRVADVMSPEVVGCRPEDALAVAMELMERHHIRHLPVMDTAGRLVGILSQRDVLAALLAAAVAEIGEERERVLLQRLRGMHSGPAGA